MEQETPPVTPQRTEPYQRLERMRRFGARRAYLWRDGVRWRSRTYAELHDRVLACAVLLESHGLRPGQPVLIQGPDHPDWVEALLATFVAGGVAVPLEVSTPDPFRNLIAERVEGRLLVAPPSVPAPPGCRRIDFGAWGAAAVTRPSVRPPSTSAAASAWRGAGLSDRAEIVFTSGTTGEPKGVVLTHDNLASDFAPLERAFLRHERIVRAVGEVRFLTTLPLSHMFGQAMNVFLSGFMGLTVAFVPPRPRDIVDAAGRVRPLGLFTVPRLLELLAAEVRRIDRAPGDRQARDERLAHQAGRPFWRQALAARDIRRQLGWRMSLLVSGGAALTDPVREFWERCGYLIVQGYGLTETAPIVSISNPFQRGRGNVGKALKGQEVKIGADGEILVRGANVTSGYHGEAQGGASEWLRTGDVGEIDAQGRLVIKGRLKDVIVTPEGENVYATDVEGAFGSIAGVRDVCAFGFPYEGGERVHVALILEPGAAAAAAVAAANERLLPKQRVRDFTVWSGADFPRTATGKVRRMLVREQAVRERGDEVPGAPTAHAGAFDVRALVARVARVPVERLSGETALVRDLGLASLDLVELAAALEEEYGAGLPEERLAEATIGDLEAAARAALAGQATTPLAPRATDGPSAPLAGEHAAAGASASGVAAGSAAGAERVEPGAIAAADAAGAPSALVSGELRMPRWARSRPARLFRRFVEESFFRPIAYLYSRPVVEGLENLRLAEPPYLFVSNHHSYFDTGLLKAVLPRPLRGRIAPGMTTRYHRVFFGEVRGTRWRCLMEGWEASLVELFVGAWPLPETAGFRRSVVYAGEIADAGDSILIFPEGRHVEEGSFEPFRGGIGVFARELRAPVVPMYVEGTHQVLPDGAWWPRFGRARMRLGRPLEIDPEADATEVTRRLEAAVRDLAAGR